MIYRAKVTSFKYCPHNNRDSVWLLKRERVVPPSLLCSHPPSLEVEPPVFVMSSGLSVFLEAESSCFGQDRAVNEDFVQHVVDLGECVVVAAGDAEGRGEANAPEAEEISEVHETEGVETGSRQVETSVAYGHG